MKFLKHIREEVSVPDGRHNYCFLLTATNWLIVFMTYGQPLIQQLTVAWKSHQPSLIIFFMHRLSNYSLWLSIVAPLHSSLWVRGERFVYAGSRNLLWQKKNNVICGLLDTVSHKQHILNKVTDLDKFSSRIFISALRAITHVFFLPINLFLINKLRWLEWSSLI